jgi:hypothetical protein
MTDVHAFVWHDLDGNVTAVGHVVGDRKVEPVTRDGRRVLKLTIAEEHLPTLHLTHAVDVEHGKLSPRNYKPAASA